METHRSCHLLRRGRYRTRVDSEKIPGLSETSQGAPSMSKSMETKTAAMYLRKSTEDDGKSVAQQERELRIRFEQLGVGV